ncbi:double-strand break repair protein AddB [Afipia carboxidovorans OM5]|uniref:Double-strand break repair protein AddB n=1 Tax=Afipia carboxidovorans (strain ATCC 49405 / DSM 1227 / KCTC 32145 / OM5) TaxID=504832 RepID=F8C086_AFIC5|nr:double-strand break repair protein AddB [Afipia carboxidovorans]AEI01211.1 double-strand break repair protein AddB [Afipia carboxidovorans OM4]AEI04785.1 double-strand break repair protein AddB [Afipia carboxidovorans OM5]
MRLFNIPSSAPFLRTLLTALADGRLIEGFEARKNPERLAEATLYLPTQRACRMAREVFLDVMEQDAVLLPRIVALGHVDEDELAFAQDEATEFPSLNVPDALDGLPRRLVLMRLVSAWAKRLGSRELASAPLVAGGPASTLALADDLARLIDDMTTRGVDWHALNTLVPDDLDQYWKITLDFLKIASEAWPAHLRESELIEPVARRDLLIAAEAARMAAAPGPFIAAGSTGSMPSTAKFLHAVAQHPQGAVVLPGLDTDLDDEAWRAIGGVRDSTGRFAEHPLSSHPQYALHGLLDVFGVDRKAVRALAEPSAHGRELIASEAMRPARETAQWHHRLADPDVTTRIEAGFDNLAIVEAANPEMEALAIATAMREARQFGKTTALVTPDRALARRVMAALGRWQLPYDDSGGDSLMDTPAGIFARLAAETVTSELAPPTLLALLKHPLLRLGAPAGGWTKATANLELAVLRGTRPAPGCKGLQAAFAAFVEEWSKTQRKELSTLHPSEPRARLTPDDIESATRALDALVSALAPLESVVRGTHDFATLAQRHYETITHLSRDNDGLIAAFAGTDGQQLASAFNELAPPNENDVPAPTHIALEAADYPDLFATAFANRVVRRPENSDAALRIYGLLEARLTQCDRVILGGLVEGVWPPAPRIDPWLSRPMRHELGLDLPERRIGLTAHDFAQLLGAKEVIITHATKVGGAPAVASRFLHRMKAIAGTKAWTEAEKRGADYVRYAEALDAPDSITPVAQPAPTPPVALRPLQMSVTEIEDWLRDPYTIFAKRILKLTLLDPVDLPLTAADRGSAIHNALGDFTQKHSKTLPEDIVAELRFCGEEHFAALMAHPEARALWWPRFLRIADWFAGWELRRRAETVEIAAEQRGEIAIPLGDGREFRLSARADRIELRADRTFAIIDYKTGQPPSNKQVQLGLSPQLTLEAAILRGGGFRHAFASLPANPSVSELVYVRLSGNNPAGKEQIVNLTPKGGDVQLPDDAADAALAKLTALIRKFDDPKQAYNSLALAMWSDRYGVYDDLARIKEWSVATHLGGGDA